MTKTTQDLATRVLRRLKVIGPTDEPEAEDAASVEDFYAGQLAEMAVDNLVYWDEDSIPDEAFEALTDFIAGRIATDFGPARPDLEASGTARLQRLASQGGTGFIVTGPYF